MVYNGDENEKFMGLEHLKYDTLLRTCVENNNDFGSLDEFESIWGSIEYKKNFIHYLLKYRYKQNWDREVRENYLGYSTDDIIKLVGDEYEVIYRKDYILPFLYNKVEEDFGIKIDTPTHTNLIFKKK